MRMSAEVNSALGQQAPTTGSVDRRVLYVVPASGHDPVARPQLRRLALVGNPNVGKSVIFGALTGTYATVSNYPGTTVEVARAAAHTDSKLEIIDTPGVNNL